jgi:hypothetical protein
MLIERWERFRGVDRWPEVWAVVKSVQSWGLPSGGSCRPGSNPPPVMRPKSILKVMTIEYRCVGGVMHSKTVWLFFCSQLFALDPGDDFYVQCCPDNPERIYIRESTQGNFQTVFVVVAILFFSILLFTFFKT